MVNNEVCVLKKNIFYLTAKRMLAHPSPPTSRPVTSTSLTSSSLSSPSLTPSPPSLLSILTLESLRLTSILDTQSTHLEHLAVYLESHADRCHALQTRVLYVWERENASLEKRLVRLQENLTVETTKRRLLEDKYQRLWEKEEEKKNKRE